MEQSAAVLEVGEQFAAALEVGCLVVVVQNVTESRVNYISASARSLLEVLYIGNGKDDCGEWIYAQSISSGMQGWLLKEVVKLHTVDDSKPVVGDVMIVREMVAAPSPGYLALDRGDIVCVQYVGTTGSKEAGWLFGECPQGSKKRGWLPAAMM